eukprot:60491-Rhodomonas_salina.1
MEASTSRVSCGLEKALCPPPVPMYWIAPLASKADSITSKVWPTCNSLRVKGLLRMACPLTSTSNSSRCGPSALKNFGNILDSQLPPSATYSTSYLPSPRSLTLARARLPFSPPGAPFTAARTTTSWPPSVHSTPLLSNVLTTNVEAFPMTASCNP